MSSSVLDPASADLTLLQDRQVAVLGFGALAEAHALNLRDSGVDVWVGTDPDSRGAARAELEGLAVSPPEEAVARCDIVLVPTGPDQLGERDLAVVQALVDEHTEPGDLVVVTSGGVVADGSLNVPDKVDLAMLRAVGDGARVRDEYLDGRGCPALVGVARDGSGAAWPTLTAYAAAMGALRSGAIVTTLEHEAAAGEYAESRVFSPLRRSVEDAFEELVSRGVGEEVAYLAVVHELRTRVDSFYLGRGARTADPLQQVGRRVRAMMSWIR